jgi:hypothetical protein
MASKQSARARTEKDAELFSKALYEPDFRKEISFEEYEHQDLAELLVFALQCLEDCDE